MSRVEIDEQVLDKLLEKALPEEYEVLMEGYGLSEDEEEYLLLLLLLFKEILDKTKAWFFSWDNYSIDDLDIFFFDEMRDEIQGLFREHFMTIMVLLAGFYDDGRNHAYSDLNVMPMDFGNDSSALNLIKHQNYQVISGIIDGISNNMRDCIWNGLKDGVDIGGVGVLLDKNAFNPIGKFTPQQRAEMIATTEHSRAYNTGKLQTYQNYGVQLVDIVTMHDERVCQVCIGLEQNNPYTAQEAEGLIPAHPRCRCTFKPHYDEEYVVEEFIPQGHIVDLTNY